MNLTLEIMNQIFDIVECPYPVSNQLKLKGTSTDI